MSASDFSVNEPKYYDPAEVDAYINDASNTIKTLQSRLTEATRRADEAERASTEGQPETASLGRALLLASEVADKTISEADAKAAAIVHAAEERATAIIARAESEAQRVIDAAQDAAADVFRNGEARLMAAVAAFVEGSNVLREELAKVQDDATGWRGSRRQSVTPSPVAAPQRPDSQDVIHDRVAENGTQPPGANPQGPVRTSGFFPPRAPFTFPGDQSAGDRS